MTPEPSPWSVSSCTTVGSSALATAATGSSPALICDGVTATGVPGEAPEALALLDPRSRSCPRPKPAPSSRTTATAAATRRELLRRGGRPPLPEVGPPQDGPAPEGCEGSGIGRVSVSLQGGAPPPEAQDRCGSVTVPAAAGMGPGAPGAGVDGPPPGPAPLQPLPAPP